MKPEKPQDSGTPRPSANKAYDALLDPLPLPEVIESDSDTAWGLWQDSIQPSDDKGPNSEFKDQAYDDTAPLDLTDPDTSP